MVMVAMMAMVMVTVAVMVVVTVAVMVMVMVTMSVRWRPPHTLCSCCNSNIYSSHH